MPEQRRVAAIARLETEVIAKFQGARPLTNAELAAHGNGLNDFAAGWEFASLIPGEQYRLRLLLPDMGPFARPRVAVHPLPPIAWPHLEERGLLCLSGDNDPHSPEDVVAAAVHVIQSARALVIDSIAGKGFDQFEGEFVSYWSRWAKAEKSLRSICVPDGPSREVSAWYGKSFTVVGEDDATLRRWLNGFFGDPIEDRNFVPQRIPFLWLKQVPQPSDFPNTVGALFALVREDARAKELLENLLCDTRITTKVAMLGCRTSRGTGLVAAQVIQPAAPKGGGDPLSKGGFRNGPPRHILVSRFMAASVIGLSVERFDPSWVHGRDNNADLKELHRKSVLILGIGSVGSPVATLLAQAGVGAVHLVDPQTLGAENTSRHELGAASVLRLKAADHAANLRRRFPHLGIESHTKRWQQLFHENGELFRAADLIISTIGDWPVESQLNATVISQADLPPVLYGWTEPHAAAGHAVLFVDRSACLRCITNDIGQVRVPVTEWPGKTTKDIPACGGSFQPYGAAELAHINAVVADLALDFLLGRATATAHRIWIGRRKVLDRAGGAWSREWLRAHGDPKDGGQIVDIHIHRDVDCPECKAKT